MTSTFKNPQNGSSSALRPDRPGRSHRVPLFRPPDLIAVLVHLFQEGRSEQRRRRRIGLRRCAVASHRCCRRRGVDRRKKIIHPGTHPAGLHVTDGTTSDPGPHGTPQHHGSQEPLAFHVSHARHVPREVTWKRPREPLIAHQGARSALERRLGPETVFGRR